MQRPPTVKPESQSPLVVTKVSFVEKQLTPAAPAQSAQLSSMLESVVEEQVEVLKAHEDLKKANEDQAREIAQLKKEKSDLARRVVEMENVWGESKAITDEGTDTVRKKAPSFWGSKI